MPCRTPFVAILALTLAVPGHATDDPPGPPTIGARVRATLADKERITGRLVGIAEDSLRIERKPGKEVTVARKDIVAFERSVRRGRRRRGAFYGFLVGVAAAVVLARTGEDPPPCDPRAELCLFGEDGRLFSEEEETVMGAILLAPVGALLGAAVAPGEKWTPTDASSFRVSVAPVPGRGVAVRVAIAF